MTASRMAQGSDERAPSSARVVVIGGGIGGASAAYHLAKLGVKEVQLLERAEMSSGTTWHSTANMETYRADPLIFSMVQYAAALYPRLAADSERDIGWRVVGRVMYTDREERWEQMRTLPELGRARGIAIETLSPEQVHTRLPIIAADELIGGLWVPSDARVNPSDAVSAFAHLARASSGVVIRERCAVLGISVRNNCISGVITSAGEIACDTIVLAGGLWSSHILSSCGLRLPLHALEHQYLITRPFGVDRSLPLFLSFDDQLYGREEVGGLIVGSLDDHAIPISTAELPQDFASCLLSERWDQFEPYMATAMRRFPALQSVPVKMLLNGPESFTPDGQMLLGPVPGVRGLYAVCGFNSNGMALAPAAGRYIAEWIVEGAPSADVAALDIRRFSSEQSDPKYLRERVTEIPGYQCRMHSSDEDYQTARDLRRSPVHPELSADGARFASVGGWERPVWLNPRGLHSSWLDAVAQETRAAVAGALLIDRSSDVKYFLAGAGVREWLNVHAPPLHAGEETQVLHITLPGERGEVEALARALEYRHDRCLLAASPDQETRVREWLRRMLPAHFHLSNATDSLACLEMRGPARAHLLQAIRAEGAVRFVAREDPLQDSTVITCNAESGARFWRRLRDFGARYGLLGGGYLAEEAIRIARGIPAFGREVTPAISVGELKGELRSRRILAAFASPISRLGLYSRDVILQAGRTAGELTSRIRLPGWDGTLALGRLDADYADAATFETVVDGEASPLLRRESAWSDALRSLRA